MSGFQSFVNAKDDKWDSSRDQTNAKTERMQAIMKSIMETHEQQQITPKSKPKNPTQSRRQIIGDQQRIKSSQLKLQRPISVPSGGAPRWRGHKPVMPRTHTADGTSSGEQGLVQDYEEHDDDPFGTDAENLDSTTTLSDLMQIEPDMRSSARNEDVVLNQTHQHRQERSSRRTKSIQPDEQEQPELMAEAESVERSVLSNERSGLRWTLTPADMSDFEDAGYASNRLASPHAKNPGKSRSPPVIPRGNETPAVQRSPQPGSNDHNYKNTPMNWDSQQDGFNKGYANDSLRLATSSRAQQEHVRGLSQPDLQDSHLKEPARLDVQWARISGSGYGDDRSPSAPLSQSGVSHSPAVEFIPNRILPLMKTADNSNQSKEDPYTKLVSELDYTPEQLKKMNYQDLKVESFDYDPRKGTSSNSPQPLSESELSKKLDDFSQSKPSTDLSAQRSAFFSSLTMEQHEQCGTLIVDHLHALMTRYVQARRQRRTAALEFEAAVAEREQLVHARKEALGQDLARLRRAGEEVVGGKGGERR